MLVLSRKIGESVIIGESVCVTVVAVHGHRVRLGFSSPEDVLVCRAELLEQDSLLQQVRASDLDSVLGQDGA